MMNEKLQSSSPHGVMVMFIKLSFKKRVLCNQSKQNYYFFPSRVVSGKSNSVVTSLWTSSNDRTAFFFFIICNCQATMNNESLQDATHKVVSGRCPLWRQKAGSRRVVTGHFLHKMGPVSRHVKVGDINGALHFLTHTFLICSTVSSLSRFLVITLLCFWNSRANQAWRMSSPTRTLKAVIFLLSLLFFFSFLFFLSQYFFLGDCQALQ